MNAIVLSIGDELVLGLTVDTNSAWLSRELAAIGWSVPQHITVGDSLPAIERAIADAGPRCDALLITGGLGPTKDDLTREALSRVLGAPLELNSRWLIRMEKMFRKRGRMMTQSNRAQAMIPAGARIIKNTAGTAAGIDADFPRPDGTKPCRVFAMPGVPVEMRTMFARSIAPHLAAAGSGEIILTRALHTFGMGESAIGEALGALMDRSRNPSVGTTVSDGVVTLRITARYESRSQAEQALALAVAECRRVLGDLIYAADDQSLPWVVADLLTGDSILRVSTAESCTGGLLAKMLTDIPGSSRYFQRGWITYSDQAKIELLDVDPEIIERTGAVSQETVSAMADAARRKSASDFALAISGIAGPDGGTPAKPVGTVCIALADSTAIAARTFSFPGDRQMIRDRSAKMALAMLRYRLLGKPMPF